MTLQAKFSAVQAGGGTYDPEATAARESAEARGVVLLVLGGNRGSSFVIQAMDDIRSDVPGLLRQIADALDAGRA